MDAHRVTTRALLGGTALLLPLLTACGQTGPLYLPADESATVVTRPGPTASPTPAGPAASSPPSAPAPDEDTDDDSRDKRDER